MGADVTQPLDSPANEALLPAAQWDLLVFSYVLAENMRALRAGGYEALLRGLLASLRLGACCLVLDSSSSFHEELKQLAAELGLRACCLSGALAGSKALPRNCLVLLAEPLGASGAEGDGCTASPV